LRRTEHERAAVAVGLGVRLENRRERAREEGQAAAGGRERRHDERRVKRVTRRELG